ARQLAPTDSLGASVLAGIGGELCSALLAYRDLSKTLSTYGHTMAEHLWADDRLHPEYLQVVGTDTGRLASRNPNAQNFTPRLKPYMKPSPGRVFVYSDLSQAELRFATQLAGDDGLRSAFEQGLDIHAATAERMFGVRLDGPSGPAALDRPRYEEFRTKAKRINFGILYGQRGAGLSRSLTDAGVPTSRGEADALIDAYLSAYPGIAHWVDERDRFIGHFAATELDADWQLTLRLGPCGPAPTTPDGRYGASSAGITVPKRFMRRCLQRPLPHRRRCADGPRQRGHRVRRARCPDSGHRSEGDA
ncbi:MAG: DNA polymerase, partial [Acidimicrobiaceae bacterium]|nr:DNA polymerase [Acidimicrobiaceae bacterium]